MRCIHWFLSMNDDSIESNNKGTIVVPLFYFSNQKKNEQKDHQSIDLDLTLMTKFRNFWIFIAAIDDNCDEMKIKETKLTNQMWLSMSRFSSTKLEFTKKVTFRPFWSINRIELIECVKMFPNISIPQILRIHFLYVCNINK